MQLSSLEYHEYQNRPRAWYLHQAEFARINLIAGKNATGKTRMLNVINGLARLLSGVQRELFQDGHFKIILVDEKTKYKHLYELDYVDNEVKHERYAVANKVLLNRNESGEGTIWAEELKDWISFQTPAGVLAAVSRRDKIQHPFFEDLYQWAKSLHHFSFATNQERLTLIAMSQILEKKSGERDQRDHAGTILSKALEEHEHEFKKLLLDDLTKLNYYCEDIGLRVPEGLQSIGGPPPLNIFVKEKDLNDITPQLQMSDGMFRALSLLIRLNYAILSGKNACILVDDVGEGLDFNRSTNLIPLIIDKAMKHNFQLIMTTNDVFVMNAVPLEYWSVVTREGGHVKVINRLNAPKAFDQFKYIGLNNFEFFASEYFKENQNKD